MPNTIKVTKSGLENMVESTIIPYRTKFAFAFQSVNTALVLEALDILIHQEEYRDENEWTPASIRSVCQLTNLTRFQQKLVLDKLKELGVVDVRQESLPSYRHVKINYNRLEEYMHSCMPSAIEYPYGYRKPVIYNN